MKATQAQLEQRVTEVLTLRLAGADFQDLLQYAAAQNWGIKERQLWNYVEKADERLAETTEKDRGKLLRLHLAQRRLLYAKALESGDWRGALAVKKDEAELLGLYHPLPPALPADETPPQNARDLVTVLGTLVNQLRRGEIDATTVAAVCNLAGTLMRAEESSELAREVQELLEIIKTRKATP
jgi:hypothetical protein